MGGVLSLPCFLFSDSSSGFHVHIHGNHVIVYGLMDMCTFVIYGKIKSKSITQAYHMIKALSIKQPLT